MNPGESHILSFHQNQSSKEWFFYRDAKWLTWEEYKEKIEEKAAQQEQEKKPPALPQDSGQDENYDLPF